MIGDKAAKNITILGIEGAIAIYIYIILNKII